MHLFRNRFLDATDNNTSPVISTAAR